MKQKIKPSEWLQNKFGIGNWCHDDECTVCQKQRRLIDKYLTFKK